jgi:hypothetical protein
MTTFHLSTKRTNWWADGTLRTHTMRLPAAEQHMHMAKFSLCAMIN